MTDLTLALKLLADATSAVSGLQKVRTEVQQTGTAARGLGDQMQNTGQDGAAAFTALSARLTEAMREIDLLKTKIAGMRMPSRLPVDTERVGTVARHSAAQVGNLTAQFNDIGMMMASGQNPLMTAIQQGTQVGQVIGPMGAAGAAKALAAGFGAMLNPLNLGIMAAIAFGSTLVQWLVSGGEKVKSLDDGLADLQSAVKDLQTASHRSLAELKKDYGAVTPEVQRLNDEMADLAGVQALLAATEAMRGLKAETEGSWWAIFTDKAFTDAGQVAARLGAEPLVVDPTDGEGLVDNPVIQQFQDAVTAAQAAQGLDAQISAFSDLRRIIIEAAGGIDSMTRSQADLLAKIDQTEAALRRQRAVQTPPQLPGANTPEEARALADRERALATTREEIAGNTRTAALQRQIALYGEDSAAAALARLQSERDVYEAQKKQSGIAGPLKDQAMAAWDAANGMADAQKAAADELDKAREAGRKLYVVLSDAWDATAGLSNAAPGAGWMAHAISGVDTLIGRLQEAFRASAAISFAETPALTGPAGMGQSPPTGGAVSTSPRPGQRSIDFDHEPPVVATSGSGGGGGSNPLASLQAQARAAMVQLDQSIAAINEKVAVGLTSASDAADGITAAKEQAAGALAELIAQLDDMGPAGQQSAAVLRVALQGMADDLKAVGSVGQSVGQSLGEALKAPLADFILGTRTATQAFDDFVGSMAQTIAQKLSSRFTDAFITPLIDSVIGSIFPGLSFATGGVPGLAEFSNQVLTQPTRFAMPGGGLGQAGEAGREAIMPLKDGPGRPGVRAWMGGWERSLDLMRGPDGNLGVKLPEWQSPALRAPQAFARGGVPGQSSGFAAADGADPVAGARGAGQGASAGNVYVTVTNNAQGTEIRQTERLQGNDRFVEVMIDTVRHAIADDIAGGRGPVPAAIEGIYGAQRMGR